MYFDYSKEKKHHKLYYPGKMLAYFLSKLVYRRVDIKGRENIPEKGALIIASNHIAFSDPAVIAANFPRAIHFMAKSELFEKPFIASFMRNMNAFPVKRNSSDRNALRYAKDIIAKGWVLGIFPEGRRNQMSPPTKAKAGIAYLAKVTGADVLPVCIYRNADDAGAYHSLSLVFGKVINNGELKLSEKGNDGLNEASEYIMKKIIELWEKENDCYNS